jgi:hypothetical protein
MMGGPRRRGGVVRRVGRTAVVAGTATAVAGGVSHRQSRKYHEADQEAAAEQQAAYDQGIEDAAPPPPAPAPAAPAAEDTVAQLERLADLKKQGILTEDEFASQKAKILGI